MIPKKLNFTYINDDLPLKYQDNLKKWKTNCPNWEIHYYSDEAVQAFFDQYFPQYATDIPKVPNGAMIADLFRYAVLYIHGGLYSDIDTVPARKIPEEWFSKECVFGYEYQPSKFPESMRPPWRNEEYFCQWTLLSSPKYPLYKDALDRSFQGLRAIDFEVERGKVVLEVGGPMLFTKVAKAYISRPEVLVLDADFFSCNDDFDFPLTKRSVVQHQFDGNQGWILNVKLPHLKLNS